MRWLVVLAVSCGGSTRMTPGWKPTVWALGPSDPRATLLAIPFSDPQNGTELVTAALTQARAAGATGLSDIAIQLGNCIRDISLVDHAPLVAPVIFETTESDLACRRTVDQELVVNPDATTAAGKPSRFRDTTLVEHEACAPTTHTRVVTRERVDFEHGFSPPRWDAIAHWSGLPLRAGALHCDAHESRNELRMRLHFGDAPPSPLHALPPPSSAAPILAAVAQARTSRDPADAEAALALWRAADFEAGQPPELAAAIAEAAYLAVESDAARFLAKPVGAPADLAWMEHNTAELREIAERYKWIGDSVRVPAGKPWMQAAGQRLAAMHLHLAELYDSLDRAEAARQERIAAQALASAASGAPVSR